ncbi:MAG: glutathione S-transferase C-terminal domain-containing protein, partial [Gammaproteobacteria bacterium]|nr:glutathione S-transferase C-terminal domain-containing protein [Gammaproteobacteria bacterium]
MPKKMLIDGIWHNDVEDTPALREQRREEKRTWFRSWVGRGDTAMFEAEPGRYHLYVSYAGPWAHRTILYRRLKRLEGVISMSVVHPKWAGPHGWEFGTTPFSTEDHLYGFRYLYETYQLAKRDFTGIVTVPVLFDRREGTIVNNESGEIIRMLNSAFDAWGDASVDFYPPALRAEIDRLSGVILSTVCSGVYAAGFASTQQDYDRAVGRLFAALDELEQRLARQDYLLGRRVTESDWHLFATLCRFDAAYHGPLKCNLRRLIDYPALAAYTKRLYELPGVAETVRFDHIKRHYYDAIPGINHEIVAAGPAVQFTEARFGSAADAGVSDSGVGPASGVRAL